MRRPYAARRDLDDVLVGVTVDTLYDERRVSDVAGVRRGLLPEIFGVALNSDLEA